MESRVQAALATLPPAQSKSALETMEHLALLKRWFYRSTPRQEKFSSLTPKAGCLCAAWYEASPASIAAKNRMKELKM